MYKFSKRILDIIISGTLLLFFSPIMVFTAILIKISSPGPIFYIAKRSGLYGKSFLMFKFRTMYVGADKASGTTALKDSRIIKYGFFLRSYKIDELPQLINVFIGNMSLVGPRPELLDYVAKYKGEEKLITTVKPGITDYSSLYFFSQENWVGEENPGKTFDKTVLPVKVSLRIKYVKEQSLYNDLKIMILTSKVLLKKILGIK